MWYYPTTHVCYILRRYTMRRRPFPEYVYCSQRISCMETSIASSVAVCTTRMYMSEYDNKVIQNVEICCVFPQAYYRIKMDYSLTECQRLWQKNMIDLLIISVLAGLYYKGDFMDYDLSVRLSLMNTTLVYTSAKTNVTNPSNTCAIYTTSNFKYCIDTV